MHHSADGDYEWSGRNAFVSRIELEHAGTRTAQATRGGGRYGRR